MNNDNIFTLDAVLLLRAPDAIQDDSDLFIQIQALQLKQTLYTRAGLLLPVRELRLLLDTQAELTSRMLVRDEIPF